MRHWSEREISMITDSGFINVRDAEAYWYPPYSYASIKQELRGKQELKARLGKVLPELKFDLVFDQKMREKELSMSKEFNPISVSTVDGRVSIGMSREEALELYVAISEGCGNSSHVAWVLQGLLKDYFVKGTAVMSEDFPF